MKRIEIVEMPSGKFAWSVYIDGQLVYAGSEHDSAINAEVAARVYVTRKHSGVLFALEHCRRVW